MSALFRSTRWLRVTVILMTPFLALLVGVITPALTYAAPPMQTPEPPATPDALAAAILVLVGMLITFVSGGGISVLLEMIPAWTNWTSPMKGYIVIALSILIVAALTSAKVVTTPEALAGLPDWAIVFLGSVVFSLTALLGTQLTYKRLLK
jgi:predicted permease